MEARLFGHPVSSERLERFWANVKQSEDPNKCWAWLGSKDKNGRGSIRVLRDGKITSIRAARAIFSFVFGEPPEELHVLHNCDNPNCVNPKHLHLGTHRDNMRESKERKRIPSGLRHYKNRFSREEQQDIKARFLAGESSTQLGKEFSVSGSTILRVVERN